MKGKILCPAGCQNPVARITKAKEILKNPRPAGSWRPLKCIFSGKGKSRSQRAAKPRSGVILAKGKKAAHSGPQALSCPFYVRKNQTGAVCGSLRASFYHGAKIRNSAVLSLAGNLLGSAFPKPCLCGFCRLSLPLSCGKRKEVITMPKRYNTPHRSRVIKTRLTEEEYADFTARLSPYGMSQSEFIRQAITRATIRPIVTVSPVNDELLAAVGKLTLPP